MRGFSQQPNRRFVAKQINYRNPYFHRESKHERNHRFRRLYTFISILVFAGLVYLFIYSNLFKVSSIEVNSPSTGRLSFVNNIVNEYLEEKSLFIFPNDNWLFLSSNNLNDYLKDKIEEAISVEYITTEKKVWNKVIITFEERTATVLLKENDDYYYLDNQGVVVSQYVPLASDLAQEGTEEGEEYESLPNFPIIEGETQSSIEIGKSVLPAKLVQSVLVINDLFPERIADLEIKNFTTIIRECYFETISEEGPTGDNDNNDNDEEEINYETIEICPQNDFSEFGLITNNDLTIYFTTNQSETDQINSLYLSLNEELETKIDNLSYIDLRYLPRVYYK